MSGWLLFAIFGTGAGGLYAALAISMVISYRASGVVNFAQVAMATYPAFEYVGLRNRGELTIPFLPWHQPIHVGHPWPFWPSFVVAMAVAGFTGFMIELLVFRWLRTANAVTKVIASIGTSTAMLGLITVQYSTSRGIAGANSVKPILPRNTVRIFGTNVTTDRFWLVGVVAVIGFGLWAVYKWTWFGLATRATAQNQTGSQLLGISADLVASLNWVLAGMVAGLTGILSAPMLGVSLRGFEVFIAYSLAAAMACRLRSFSLATVAGVGLGMFESITVRFKGQHWMPSVLKGGFESAVPFVVIVVVLVLSGETLPTRGTIIDRDHAPAPAPRFDQKVLVPVLGVAIAVLGFGNAQLRLAMIQSLTVALLSLSFVVMAGFVGQVTLAELTFAGMAAYAVAHVAGADHLGFPWSPLIAIGITTVVATILSVPAVRVRGLHLVIVTYSGAIALQEVILRNPRLTGMGDTVTTPMPSLFGWGFGAASGPHKPGNLPYKPFGFLVLLVTVGCTLMVVNIRRSSLGRRMLAVRANERAAAAVGIRVPRTKLYGASIGSFVAACAGVLWAYKFISFNNAAFPASDSLIYIGAVFIGGISMVSGAYIAGFMASGGILLELIGHGQGPARWQLLVSGAGMVLVTIRFPGGIASLGPYLRRRWAERNPEPSRLREGNLGRR